MMRRYVCLSAVSGLVWGVVSWRLGHEAMPLTIWGGIIASPFIGVIVGLAFLPAYRLSRLGQFGYSLATLYLALLLFGLAAGSFGALRQLPSMVPSALFAQEWPLPALGVTATGWVLALWPLAYFNHRIVGNVRVAA